MPSFNKEKVRIDSGIALLIIAIIIIIIIIIILFCFVLFCFVCESDILWVVLVLVIL